ncbi:hypothetical protein B0H34DRAFT_714737 [Crassisporium funariophilum]|nr:hypothetical protein B0H34DRAFT_714737 [Crassisporium funariophilum]
MPTTGSTTKQLIDHKVLIFDVYGTLADWETGLYTALQPLLSHYPKSKAWSRKEALTAFGSVELDLQAQYPDMLYSDLLAKAHEVLEQRLQALSGKPTSSTSSTVPLQGDPAATSSAGAGSSSSASGGSSAANASSSVSTAKSDSSSTSDTQDTHQAFGNSIKNWPIFPDTTDALRRLSEHFKLVVLSNVDRASFRYTHALLSSTPDHKKLGLYTYPTPNPHKYWHPQTIHGSQSPFTLVLTAQDTGCYKPALGGFLAALDYIGSQPHFFGDVGQGDEVKEKVLSVAQSLPHDHEPASQIGMKSVWIDRQAAVTCNEMPGGVGAPKKWTWRFETLGEMADAVERELAERK